VKTGKTYAKSRWSGRFYGRRVNCEYVPALPARVLQIFLNDPRRILYFLVWKNPQGGRELEIVRIARDISRVNPADWTGWIEIEWPDQQCTYVRTVERLLPRNGGKVQLVVCPGCQAARRSLYGWRPGGTHTTSAERAPLWECRKCLGLRYSSEGGALNHHSRAATAPLIQLLLAPLTSDIPKRGIPASSRHRRRRGSIARNPATH
jgi:hypothetical protein